MPGILGGAAFLNQCHEKNCNQQRRYADPPSIDLGRRGQHIEILRPPPGVNCRYAPQHWGRCGVDNAEDRNENPREGGDSIAGKSLYSMYMFQSTPPRGGRRLTTIKRAPSLDVSIHAPARGATIKLRASTTRPWVSIHAPARGATSRRPDASIVTMVSIHAPARGAT